MAELTEAEAALSPEELKKEVKLRIAESLLKEIDPDFELEWVKAEEVAGLEAFSVGTRRVIQMKG